MKLFLAAASASLLAVFSPAVHAASTTYTYTGNPLLGIIDDANISGTYVNTDQVSGYFTLPFALAPNQSDLDLSLDAVLWEFTDGRSVLTQANSFFDFLQVSTDANGDITSHFMEVQTIPNVPLDFGTIARSISAYNVGAIGSAGAIFECVNDPCAALTSGFGNVDAGTSSVAGSWATSTTVVPAPPAVALLLAGLGALGFARRTRG